MSNLFHEILYRPILNVLVWLYNTIPGHDIGLAIIGVTIIIRLVLYPSFRSSIKHQRAIEAMRPKLDELKEKHKDDKQAQMQAVMELYKEHQFSPFASCLPILIQLPVILALFMVLRNELPKENIEGLYNFVSNPGSLGHLAFGIMDVTKSNFIIAALAGLLQYFQTKMLQAKSKTGVKTDVTTAVLQKQMLYFLPAMTFIFGLSLPSGLPLYWAASTLFAIGQQWFIMNPRKKAE